MTTTHAIALALRRITDVRITCSTSDWLEGSIMSYERINFYTRLQDGLLRIHVFSANDFDREADVTLDADTTAEDAAWAILDGARSIERTNTPDEPEGESQIMLDLAEYQRAIMA